MAKNLAEFQAEVIARGYTHNFAFDAGSSPASIESELRIAESASFDSGTDPGDDVTMYLVDSGSGQKGYIILSDSFHADPRKAAFIGVLLARQRADS